MKAHLLSGENIVINTIVVSSLRIIPRLIDASSGGSIGDFWDGKNFIPPEVPDDVPPKEDDYLDIQELRKDLNELKGELKSKKVIA